MTEVKGAAELVGGLQHMAQSLQDMSTAHRAASRLILEAARARTPVATGKLQASGSYDASRLAGSISFSAPYAGPVHWGIPSKHRAPTLFILKGAQATEKQWVDVYQKTIDSDLNAIGGA